MTTLADLHNELNITQRLALYVKNQNKKYGTHYTENMPLPDSVAFLIRLNTLGKKRKHKEQLQELRDMVDTANVSRDIANKHMGEVIELKQENSELKKKVQRAEKVVNQTNLRDAIIEIYEAMNTSTPDVIQKEVGRKYAGKAFQFMEWYQVRQMLNQTAKDLTKQLKELEK
ncbi:hypothetical protein AXI71_gp11 [Lactococcus phage GE1]|uniref:Uncharacterized protein n=1 Tax=Lactococcus phage GE1 TaxID=1698369 RepID=A0A0N9BAS6_9CAUD|nr:hypothetical protein AXI71_gp11 [Lactococcus phage GE1]ALA06965.1 hypothetical protein [Lactococcus phage GE1]